MVEVRRSTVINAPVDAVWRVLRDFNGHDLWHPAVARSRLDRGQRTDQVGAVRDFTLTDGARVRERLLSLSDKDHRFRYSITESDIPIRDYVAEVALKSVTDGNRTFWSWSSRFGAPPGRDRELAQLVAEEIYEAGFEAVRRRVTGGTTESARSSVIAPSTAAIDGEAMVIDGHGGPEVMRPTRISAPSPGPGEIRLRHTAIGVNYIDVYCRTGYFDLIDLPGAPGLEAAGVVVDVGSGVRHLRPGQRVGYACPPTGAYATVRTMPAALVVPLPDTIDDEAAAAGLLKGMTAEFLVHRVHRVQRGETIVVFAPAGGVGRMLCQWANHLGATVIGATSTEEKARLARAAGAQHVILPGDASLGDQVRDLTGGRGADVIYDAVGRDTFEHSLDALATRGHLVSFGQASGPIGSHDIGALALKSVTLSRPNYGHYVGTPEDVVAITTRLFDALKRRIVSIEIGRRYPLREAADAHRALEARETTASTILIPDAMAGETA